MDAIMAKVQAASGSAVHVLSAEEAATRPQFASVQEKTSLTGPSSPYAHPDTSALGAASITPSTSGSTSSSTGTRSPSSSSASRVVGVPRTSTASSKGGVQFPDEDGMQAAIADVRNDASSTDYCMLGYEGRTANVVLKHSGTGGVDALRAQLDDAQALYALVRLADSVDGHKTVKFVFVRWIGSRVPIMQRARLGTHQGRVGHRERTLWKCGSEEKEGGKV
jgi:drebrin-like protein